MTICLISCEILLGKAKSMCYNHCIGAPSGELGSCQCVRSVVGSASADDNRPGKPGGHARVRTVECHEAGSGETPRLDFLIQ